VYGRFWRKAAVDMLDLGALLRRDDYLIVRNISMLIGIEDGVRSGYGGVWHPTSVAASFIGGFKLSEISNLHLRANYPRSSTCPSRLIAA
jgi:hypothetical protein